MSVKSRLSPGMICEISAVVVVFVLSTRHCCITHNLLLYCPQYIAVLPTIHCCIIHNTLSTVLPTIHCCIAHNTLLYCPQYIAVLPTMHCSHRDNNKPSSVRRKLTVDKTTVTWQDTTLDDDTTLNDDASVSGQRRKWWTIRPERIVLLAPRKR